MADAASQRLLKWKLRLLLVSLIVIMVVTIKVIIATIITITIITITIITFIIITIKVFPSKQPDFISRECIIAYPSMDSNSDEFKGGATNRSTHNTNMRGL